MDVWNILGMFATVFIVPYLPKTAQVGFFAILIAGNVAMSCWDKYFGTPNKIEGEANVESQSVPKSALVTASSKPADNISEHSLGGSSSQFQEMEWECPFSLSLDFEGLAPRHSTPVKNRRIIELYGGMTLGAVEAWAEYHRPVEIDERLTELSWSNERCTRDYFSQDTGSLNWTRSRVELARWTGIYFPRLDFFSSFT